MSIWLIIYIVLGPALWALYALSIALAHARMNRLKRPAGALPAVPARVSVLIPAKDEGQPVRECLDRVLAMDYVNFGVTVVDDRSSDQTGAIFDEYAGAHPQKVTAIHIPPGGLPAGWLGKWNALATAAAEAEGGWPLLVG